MSRKLWQEAHIGRWIGPANPHVRDRFHSLPFVAVRAPFIAARLAGERTTGSAGTMNISVRKTSTIALAAMTLANSAAGAQTTQVIPENYSLPGTPAPTPTPTPTAGPPSTQSPAPAQSPPPLVVPEPAATTSGVPAPTATPTARSAPRPRPTPSATATPAATPAPFPTPAPVVPVTAATPVPVPPTVVASPPVRRPAAETTPIEPAPLGEGPGASPTLEGSEGLGWWRGTRRDRGDGLAAGAPPRSTPRPLCARSCRLGAARATASAESRSRTSSCTRAPAHSRRRR
jgi:hypothetical protein